ncbi:MAG: response regulator transcription factor [Cyclobacteriaceae bacterium]
MPDKIKILIADDHQIIIDGIKSIIEGEGHLELTGQAHTGIEVLEFLRRNKIDLAILDINMPELDGVETTRVIRDKYPDIKILILTMYNKAEFVKNMAEAGAHGFILKNTGRDEMLMAIELLMEGKTYYGQEVTKTLLDSYKKDKNTVEVKLTTRELDVLQLLADGLTTPEIAEKLFISTHTVESHRKNLLSKTGEKTSAGLVRYALDNGLLNKAT